MEQKKTTEDILLEAIDAVDSALSVLMLARGALVDRIKEIPEKVDPVATMGGAAPADCPHRNVTEKNLMGGVVLKFCQDCGEQL